MVEEKTNISQLNDSVGFYLWTVRISAALQDMNELDDTDKPKASNKAKNFIVKHIGDNLLDLILLQLKTPTAPSIWAHLEKEFVKSSLSAQSTHLSSLQNFNLNATKMDASKHSLLSLKRDIQAALGGSESITLDQLLTVVTIVNAPVQYQALITALQATTTTTTLTFDSLFNHLIREEGTNNAKGLITTTKPTAHATTTVNKDGSCDHFSNKSKCWKCYPHLQPSCSTCKDLGHRYRHVENTRYCQSKPVANKADNNYSVWNLDSASTHHLTNQKQLLHNP